MSFSVRGRNLHSYVSQASSLLILGKLTYTLSLQKVKTAAVLEACVFF